MDREGKDEEREREGFVGKFRRVVFFLRSPFFFFFSD
jgi:hypothetical protein